ncbi:TetR/AcrR family transcriptional regulator [Chitinimonas lacunae]|uniref:TetR/AcrR family transcriptional regulator n=1 Tax=Chitinimonas lacunae TaxID=1963018 RepID=A0ABV8MWX6_9NEIS
MTTPCSPRWQRRKDARPAEILAAALALFGERGYANTRLDDVASRAGVTKGTLYLYFANKEELFKAAVRETVLPHIEFAEDLVADHRDDARSLLRRLLDAWAVLLSQPHSGCLSKLMMAEAANFPDLARFYLDEVVLRSRRLFSTVIERGIQDGEFRPVDVALLTREITAPLLMINIWQRSFAPLGDESIDLVEFARFHYDILLQGIDARATATRFD